MSPLKQMKWRREW